MKFDGVFYWRELWQGRGPTWLFCRCLTGAYASAARCEGLERLPNYGMWAGNVYGWWRCSSGF